MNSGNLKQNTQPFPIFIYKSVDEYILSVPELKCRKSYYEISSSNLKCTALDSQHNILCIIYILPVNTFYLFVQIVESLAETTPVHVVLGLEPAAKPLKVLFSVGTWHKLCIMARTASSRHMQILPAQYWL